MFARVVFYEEDQTEGEVDIFIPFELSGSDLEVFALREFVECMPGHEFIDVYPIDTDEWPMTKEQCINVRMAK